MSTPSDFTQRLAETRQFLDTCQRCKAGEVCPTHTPPAGRIVTGPPVPEKFRPHGRFTDGWESLTCNPVTDAIRFDEVSGVVGFREWMMEVWYYLRAVLEPFGLEVAGRTRRGAVEFRIESEYTGTVREGVVQHSHVWRQGWMLTVTDRDYFMYRREGHRFANTKAMEILESLIQHGRERYEQSREHRRAATGPRYRSGNPGGQAVPTPASRNDGGSVSPPS